MTEDLCDMQIPQVLEPPMNQFVVGEDIGNEHSSVTSLAVSTGDSDCAMYTTTIPVDFANNLPEGTVLQILPENAILTFAPIPPFQNMSDATCETIILKDSSIDSQVNSIENAEHNFIPNFGVEILNQSTTSAHSAEGDHLNSEGNISDLDLSFLTEADEPGGTIELQNVDNSQSARLSDNFGVLQSATQNSQNFSMEMALTECSKPGQLFEPSPSSESCDTVLVDVSKPIQLAQNTLIVVNGQKCVLQHDPQSGQVVAFPVKEPVKPKRKRGRPKKEASEHHTKSSAAKNVKPEIESATEEDETPTDKGLLEIVTGDGAMVRRSSRRRKKARSLKDYETGNLNDELGSDVEELQKTDENQLVKRKIKYKGPGRPKKIPTLSPNENVQRPRGRPKRYGVGHEPTQIFYITTAEGHHFMAQLPTSVNLPGLCAQDIAEHINTLFVQPKNNPQNTTGQVLIASEASSGNEEPIQSDSTVTNANDQQKDDRSSETVDKNILSVFTNPVQPDQEDAVVAIKEDAGKLQPDFCEPKQTDELSSRNLENNQGQTFIDINDIAFKSVQENTIKSTQMNDQNTSFDPIQEPSENSDREKSFSVTVTDENTLRFLNGTQVELNNSDYDLLTKTVNTDLPSNSSTREEPLHETSLNDIGTLSDQSENLLTLSGQAESVLLNNEGVTTSQQLNTCLSSNVEPVSTLPCDANNICDTYCTKTLDGAKTIVSSDKGSDSDNLNNEVLTSELNSSPKHFQPKKLRGRPRKYPAPVTTTASTAESDNVSLQNITSILGSSPVSVTTKLVPAPSDPSTVVPLPDKFLPLILPKNSLAALTNTTEVYKCSRCDFSSLYNFEYMEHLTSHSESKHCKCCEYLCFTEEEMVEHFKEKHPRCICTVCNYFAEQPYTIKRHMFRHEGSGYKCDICDKLYKDHYILKMHMKLVHLPADILFKCQICDKQFNRKAHLKRHVRTHDSVRPFKCPHCDYKGCEKSDIKKHLLVHEEPKHSCEFCGKSFRHTKNRDLHLKRHKGQRDYKCGVCNFYGYTFTEIRKHIERRHRDSPVEVCDKCGLAFKFSMDLEAHQKEGKCQGLEQDLVATEDATSEPTDDENLECRDVDSTSNFNFVQCDEQMVQEVTEETLSIKTPILEASFTDLSNTQIIISNLGQLLATQNGHIVINGLDTAELISSANLEIISNIPTAGEELIVESSEMDADVA